MSQFGIESIYRPIHEVRAAAFWGISTITSAISAFATGMPAAPALGMVATSAVMLALRAYEASNLVEAKVALAGRPFWLIKAKDFERALDKHPERLYLGRGFRWVGEHTRRAMELSALDVRMKIPPTWLLKLLRKPYKFDDVKGEPWIHGLEPNEDDIAIPLDHAEGGWSIFGTTGAGKTRLYEVLTYQMVRRGDTVIVFDPKYDNDLRLTLKRVCETAGRPEAFAEFHPAFPERSCRLDPLANFAAFTEIAGRIVDPLSNGAQQDSFTGTIWRVINAITEAMLYVAKKPSLKSLRFYTEAGPELLLEKALEKFLKAWSPGSWEDHVGAVEAMLSAPGNKKVRTALSTGSTRQQALVQVYTTMVPQEQRISAVDGIVSVAIHEREHLAKMIAQLLPLLTQLTSGSLDELLSPDYEDLSDKREILDMQKVIRGKRVLYIATNSLADATVGSAIASILLADLRAEAGARYNTLGGDLGSDKSRIHIICDEAAELVTAPLIGIMNKGRGAGMITYLATQNFSDYIAKFGDEHKARMVVGNANNRLTLRVVDIFTQKYVTEQFGEIGIDQVSRGVTSGTESEAQGLEFRGGSSTSISRQLVEKFPSHLLGSLQDLHFVAAVSGGRMFKGRLPKIIH